ncbi:MAG: hypothetical protein J7M39_02390 [Anaerolineae bacterium]|nr:hypothetical protein [Anaerolineae bacterium]
MQVVILLIAMLLVGLLMGAIGSLIWKENKPLGVAGDYGLAIVSTIAVGLLDWYVIPAMGFSDTMKYLGVAMEPALGALAVLWIVRKVKK